MTKKTGSTQRQPFPLEREERDGPTMTRYTVTPVTSLATAGLKR
jgi:hypothetical protein